MLIYAHRGDQSQFPENTAAAFAAASQYPNVGIELDVQLTKDGQLIVFHDDNLQRLCQVPGAVADFPYAKLQCLRIQGAYPIPTLEEVLEHYTGTGRINIEIKDSRATETLIAYLREYKNQHPATYQRLIISSFDQRPLELFAQQLPELERAYLSSTCDESTFTFLEQIQAAALHLSNESVTPELIERCHQKQLRLTTWTVNDLERIAELKSWNIDGIITDFPNQL